jgi:hypothetical protein
MIRFGSIPELTTSLLWVELVKWMAGEGGYLSGDRWNCGGWKW